MIGYSTEPSPRLNVISSIIPRQVLLLHDYHNFTRYPPTKQTIARSSANLPIVRTLLNPTLQSHVMQPSIAIRPLIIKTNSNSNDDSSSHLDDISVTSEISTQDQRSYLMIDRHSDLLKEIQKDALFVSGSFLVSTFF